MKLKLCFFFLMLFPVIAMAQYEQKMSFSVEAGTFKTFGWRFGDVEPMQMPNYGLGLSANAGLQFRINDRFSLSAEFGILITQSWAYIGIDGRNYLYWSIRDSVTNDLIAEGENYLDLYNYSLSLKPKYYFTSGGKWNPYLFMGVNFNISNAYYEDQGWMELDKRNLLPPGDTGPGNEFLESNIGFGLNPGIGIEYSLSEQIHLCLNTGYHFILLSNDNFKTSTREENFHAVVLQAGIRMYIFKTRDL